MRIFLFGLSFIFLLNACNVGDSHSKDMPPSNEKYLTILDFYPNTPDHNQRIRLAGKYGFELVLVSPNALSDKEKDSSLKANDLNMKKLSKKNGEDWKERYEKEVSNMYRRDTTLISTLKAEDYIKAKELELARYGNRLEFYIDTFLVNGAYRVNVYGMAGNSNKTVSFYRIYMDGKSFKILRKEENTAPFGIN